MLNSENQKHKGYVNGPLKLLNDFFNQRPHHSLLDVMNRPFDPFLIPIETVHTQTHFLIIAELPGISKEEISLELIGNQLQIRIDPNQTGNEEFAYKRKTKYQQRSVPLPHDVILDKMKATLRHGVLQVKFPKKKGKKIEIE